MSLNSRHLFRQFLAALFVIWGIGVASAQSRNVTVDLNKSTLKDLISVIEKQTSYRFSYRDLVLPETKNVTVTMKNVSVPAVLDAVLPEKGLGYTVVSDKSIVIFKKEATKSKKTKATTTVKGVIYDELQSPMIGVNVVVKGSDVVSVTDIDGAYSIKVPADGVLEVSYVGYTKKEVAVNGRTNIDIKMSPMVLDEVVVVAYGTQKKSSVTGSIDVISAEKMGKMPTANVAYSLQGTVPGLIITDNGGKPGSTPSINIRAAGTMSSTDPLVIIDGVPAGLGDFYALNSSDLESISVLKDASSAAIYGSRASNGVLLVTTKKGSLESSPKIDVSYTASIQTPTKVPELNSSWDYAMLVNESYTNAGGNPLYQPEEIEMMKDGSNPDYYANTNWWKESVKNNNSMHIANARVTGGTAKSSYMLSLGYTSQQGLINFTDYSKYNARMNLSTHIVDNLEIMGGVSYYRDNNRTPDHYSNFFSTVLNMPPYLPIKRSNGDWGHLNNEDTNPIAWITDGGHTKSYDNNLLLNGSAIWTVIPGLKARAQYSYNLWNVGSSSIYKTIEFVNEDGSVKNSNDPNSVSRSMTERSQTTLQTTIEYEKKISDHQFKVLAGFTDEHYRSHWVGASRKNIPDNNLEEIDGATGTGDYRDNWGSSDEWRMYSYFGRLNYDFAGRYFAEFNMRYDGSSRLAPGHQYTFFPSGSIGWRISEERFMEPLHNVVNNLKLRGSYGSLGNQTIGLYQYADVMANSSKEYMFGHELVPGSYLNILPNYSLGWEKSTMVDIGVDFSLLNNRLSGSYDWYRKKTNDILLNLPVSGVIGVSVSDQNAGSMASWGHELQLTWRDKVSDFNYSVTCSFSDQMNEVLDLKGTGPHIYSRTIIAEGKPLNTLYGYKCLGFFTSEEEIASSPKPLGYASQIKVGDLKYADLSGPDGVPDGVIDSYDKTDIGWSAPRYMFGLDLAGEWKGIDLRLFFQGVGKREEFIMGSLVYNPTSKSLLEDRWNPERTVEDNIAHAKLPRYVNGQQNNYETSDFYVKSAAYLRLKNLQVGYTLPQQWTKKVCMEKVRFSFSANNLFTLTSFPYVDPEGSSGGAYYPQLKTFAFGVEITLGKK
ncbi:MAG: SusC/RagA family TonB-linked outer membrane protein [Muribaculaceae bacterium]